MKRQLKEDALGSLLHKFFVNQLSTHEDEDSLVSILWQAVSWYRQTGEFSVTCIVCPQYNESYTKILPGVSVTAHRAVELFKRLKFKMARHLRYSSKVNFKVLLFDQEHGQFELMGVSPEEANQNMNASVSAINKELRQGGILPYCFQAERFIGDEWKGDWNSTFTLAENFLRENLYEGTEPFEHPHNVFVKLREFYTRVMNTEDQEKHRCMFDTEEGPGYLAAGHILRQKVGQHTIQIDVGSNPALARMNLWQPKIDGGSSEQSEQNSVQGTALIDAKQKIQQHELKPAQIRIKDPYVLDKKK